MLESIRKEIKENKTNEKIMESLIRFEKAITRIEKMYGIDNRDKWGTAKHVMTRLQISSKTTLHKIKMSGAIRTAKISSKLELYYMPDIDKYLKELANIND